MAGDKEQPPKKSNTALTKQRHQSEAKHSEFRYRLIDPYTLYNQDKPHFISEENINDLPISPRMITKGVETMTMVTTNTVVEERFRQGNIINARRHTL